MEIQNLSVLLVETSMTQRNILRQYLNDLRINSVYHVDGGFEAFKVLRDSPPELVVSALYLPDMDGAELVTNMRQDEKIAAQPFILISSESRIRYVDPVRRPAPSRS